MTNVVGGANSVTNAHGYVKVCALSGVTRIFEAPPLQPPVPPPPNGRVWQVTTWVDAESGRRNLATPGTLVPSVSRSFATLETEDAN